ncbi:hypothetical protein LOCC1_G000375 [Lachnellula occidentalis]|uniref:Kinetochore protein fta7 n=1 Tax=Lachnellula occidentalis TaxID=215460 RepID=A0A8H8SBM7_9HELO|nr:hypothetical protein LOCC1_G000375 [Lachnellula occidentalis]
MAPGAEVLKRERARPSDWWAASPAASTSTPLQQEKPARAPAPAPKAPKIPQPRNKQTETAPVLVAIPEREGLKRKRSRPSDWWAARPSTSQLKDSSGPSRGLGSSSGKRTVQDAPSAGNRGKAAKTGAEGTEAVRPMAKGTGKKTKTERPSGGSAEKQSSIEESAKDKTKKKKPTVADVEDEARGRRRTRRSEGDIQEQFPTASPQEKKSRRVRHSGDIIGVETASSTFGKARARPEKPSTAEAAPRPSRSKNHDEKSSSGPSKKSGHATARIKGKTAGRASNTENLGSKRKTDEKSKDDPPNAKRRRVSEAVRQEERVTQRQEKPPKYQHLAKVTRKVPRHTIEAKWTPLPANCIELISQLLSNVQKPVIARLKEEQKRSQASTILHLVNRKLVTKLSRGLPFPQGTQPQREDDFDFEKILDHNRALEAQLTPALHANELLEDELSKETTWLESEKAILAELEANAKAASVTRKQAERTLHPLLRSENSTIEGQDLELGQHAAVPISGIFEDENIQDIVKGIENHMDSMQGNLKQVEGVSEAIAKSKAAVQATLFDHLDTSQYEEVVLGLQ